MSLNGILPVYKPSGMSSFDVIRNLKRLRKVSKIGHGGTLDRMAQGVLPVLYGEATKAFDYLLMNPKEYIARVQCGAWTDTDDAEGEIIETVSDYDFDRLALQTTLPMYRGRIQQTAPLYSALKTEGKRSYELARSGKDVPLKQREVEIFEIDILDWNQDARYFDLRVKCGSGTYIRSLARDLGRKLGWGGYLTYLQRTYSTGISLQQCHTLESIQADQLDSLLVPLRDALLFLPALELSVEPEFIRQGRLLENSCFLQSPQEPGFYRVEKGKQLLAIIKYEADDFRYMRVFNETA